MITAIIPCYNAAAYLSEAIESVQQQSRPVDEVIVVDDCSTDDSAAIAQQYSVRLLSTPKNQGPAAARNIALNEARGDVIVWLDADDLWKEQHVETVVGLLDRFPEAAVAYSGIETFGTAIWKWSSFPCENEPRHLIDECFDHTIVPAMSVATRRQALQSVGEFDASIRISPDFDLWLRLASEVKFVCSREITALYRKHGSQISQSKHRQIQSNYRSRLRFINSLVHAGKDSQADHYRQRITLRFESDLWQYWHAREERTFHTLIALAAEIPTGKTIVRRLGLRRHIPSHLLRFLRRARSS